MDGALLQALFSRVSAARNNGGWKGARTAPGVAGIQPVARPPIGSPEPGPGTVPQSPISGIQPVPTPPIGSPTPGPGPVGPSPLAGIQPVTPIPLQPHHDPTQVLRALLSHLMAMRQGA